MGTSLLLHRYKDCTIVIGDSPTLPLPPPTSNTTVTNDQSGSNNNLLPLERSTTLQQNYVYDIPTTTFIEKARVPRVPIDNMNDDSNKKKPFRKWAYAFLIGGCNSKKAQYKGFLYNAVVAAHILKKQSNSRADIVLMIQMSVSTDETELPQEDLDLIHHLDIKLKYIPKFRFAVSETFYALQLEKFRILELEEYSRVIYMDSDVMPYCNMDYMFELSERRKAKNRLLKENAILSWKVEPSNGGFFMLEPGREKYNQLQAIIERKERKALTQQWHWDRIEGWGHTIKEWRSQRSSGTNWTFHAAFADQGLLYYYTKFHQQSVSQIIGWEIEQWGKNITSTNESGSIDVSEPVLERIDNGTLSKYSCNPRKVKRHRPLVPFRDFEHFTGKYPFHR